jgi:hypothetical protein
VPAPAHLSETYIEYIASPAWQAKRVVALDAAGHRCQVCNTPDRLDVHHRTYERFGHEGPGDLTVLCRSCHETFHETKRGRQATSPPPRRKKAKKPKRPKQPKQPSKKARKEARRLSALESENERLHRLQQDNKLKQQLVREGKVSPALRPELVHRYRS